MAAGNACADFTILLHGPIHRLDRNPYSVARGDNRIPAHLVKRLNRTKRAVCKPLFRIVLVNITDAPIFKMQGLGRKTPSLQRGSSAYGPCEDMANACALPESIASISLFTRSTSLLWGKSFGVLLGCGMEVNFSCCKMTKVTHRQNIATDRRKHVKKNSVVLSVLFGKITNYRTRALPRGRIIRKTSRCFFDQRTLRASFRFRLHDRR